MAQLGSLLMVSCRLARGVVWGTLQIMRDDRPALLPPLTALAAALVAALVLAAGCVAPGFAPAREDVRRATAVHLVALEAPPLGVPREFAHTLPGGVGFLASPLLVYNTIALLIDTPAAQRQAAADSAAYEAALQARGCWSPTLALAEEARAQLAARGLAVSVAPTMKPVPGVRDRRYTLLMENWLAPLRAWYNDRAPVADYAGPAGRPPQYVLEVAVANYELVDARLLLAVMVKLIDPADGRVCGRARAATDLAQMPRLDPLAPAFAGDASRFRQVVTEAGRELVRDCLTQLGFGE